MNENQPGGVDWTAVIAGISDAGLQWYSTVTQKPIAREQPTSLMGILTGTDYGRSGPISTYSSPIGGGVIMVAALAVIAIVILKR